MAALSATCMGSPQKRRLLFSMVPGDGFGLEHTVPDGLE